ncbi:MAG: transposase [Myxococcota bacterium]
MTDDTTDTTTDTTTQLVLPSLGIEHSPPTAASQLATAMLEGRCFDALVHLRCPGCGWRHTLRLPRARTRRIESLLPRVPVRHWVFSLGESAQPRLTAHAHIRTRVARACVAAVFAWLRRAATRVPIEGPVRCGAVSAIHRVGATLEPNVHVHALVLDGVYTLEPNAHGGHDDSLVFHPVPAPRRRDLRRTLAELRHTIDSILAKVPPGPITTRVPTRIVHRVETGPPVHPVPAALATTPTGPAHREDPVTRGPIVPAASDDALIQRSGELDVRAGPPISGNDRAVRDRLCRYVARVPFDPRALSSNTEGRLRYRLHHPFSDGTTHVELSPQALAERLEALASGDWRPPIGFHGVIAPAAATRNRQLSLIDAPRCPRTREPTTPLRCARCRGPLDIVGVESVERAA